MAKRAKKVVFGALILLAIGALYALFLSFTGVGIPCVVRLFTGLQCPGCGVTHMCMAILRFDLRAAFRANPAVFCLLPLMLLTAARLLYLYIRYGKHKDRSTQIAAYVMIGVLALFGILRNLL